MRGLLIGIGMLAIGFLAVCGVVNTVAAQAVPPQSVSEKQSTQRNSAQIAVSPSTVRLELQPGEIKTGTMTLLNNGTTPYVARLYAGAYTMADETYRPSFTERTSYSQIIDWITFSTTEVAMEPGQTVEVTYTIIVPKDVPAGGQYATLFAETSSERSVEQSGTITTKKRAGVIVNATVAGTTRQESKLIDWKIPFWQTKQLKASARVENTGNVDTKVQVTYRTEAFIGGALKDTRKNSYIVYPGTTRLIEAPTDGPDMTVGIYRVTQDITIEGKTYTNSSVVIYGTLGAMLLVGALMMLIIGGIVYGVRRYFIKRRAV